MKKALIFLLAAVMLLGVCAGCGAQSETGEAAPAAAANDEELIFRVAISSGYDTLNFFSTESALVYDFLNFCYDSLIAYDDDYNAIPRLAESWDVSDDGLDWTFHLRSDAVFNDGEPVTSADVKWTFENAVDSYMYSLHAGGIESIECPDDYTVIFHCDAPKPDMLYQIIPILPEHVWGELDDIFSYEPTELVGSGPFIYDASRSSNGNIAFVKNENYWGQKPNVDVLVFTPYDNYDTMAQAMQLGEVDACYELEKTQYDTLSAGSDSYVQIHEGFNEEHLAFNMLNDVTSDPVIRYAVDYCLDREQAIEMGYSTLGQVAYGMVNNPGYIYTPDDDIFRPFSTDKANELLDEAGYLDTDGDGIRERDGEPISLELITAAERSSWQSAIVNMLITNCAEAGIEITWTSMEKVTMWDTCYDGNPDWQLNLDGWGGDADPGCILCIFQDWEVAGYSGSGYANPEFDEAYAAVYDTVDEAERAAAIEECQRILYVDCPYSIICYDQSVEAISTRWTGYNTNNVGLFGNERIDTYLNVKPA